MEPVGIILLVLFLFILVMGPLYVFKTPVRKFVNLNQSMY
jgi:hypothetical protein